MFSILTTTGSKIFLAHRGVYEVPEKASFAKVFSKEYPKGKYSDASPYFDLLDEVYPESLGEVYPLIERLTQDSSIVAVRAKCLTEGRDFRRLGKNFSTNIPSNIVAIDVDEVLDTKEFGTFDIVDRGRYILKLLNSIRGDIFPLNAGFIAHASSSAGIKTDKIRLHMLFESNIKVTQGQLKNIFSTINIESKNRYGFSIVDLQFFNTVQLQYFADPIFRDGLIDPFKEGNKSRLEFVKGSVINLPTDLPEHVSTNAVFSSEFYSLLEQINGKEEVSEYTQKAIDELQGGDEGFLRIVPKIYHTALEFGTDFKFLEKYLTPTLKNYINNSGGEKHTVREYIENGIKESLKHFVGNSRRVLPEKELKKVPIFHRNVDSDVTDNFLKINSPPPKDHITFIKASLGTGKTTTVKRWLEQGQIKGNFLAVTNTRALVSSNAEKFEAGQYSNNADMLGFKRGNISRMSTTIHSLHKFKKYIEQIDVLFIDECDAVMNELLLSPIVKQRRECIEVLKGLLQSASIVILSDGDISVETVEAYGALEGFSKPISCYNHHRKMLAKTSAFELPDESSVWVTLQTALEIGEKCILVSDCGPDELNEKAIALRKHLDVNIKEIHANSTEDVDIRRILDYTTNELIEQKVDCLLCSPSVTNGVDFNYFDSIFVITKSSNQAPNMRFQAIRRDRGAKNIWYYTDKKARNFAAGVNQYDQASENWLERMRYNFLARREKESRKFDNTLRYYLLDQGAHIVIYSESWGTLEDAREEYNEQRVNAILCSTPDYTAPRHADAYETKLLIVQYYHLDSIKDITREHVEQYLEDKPHKKAEYFHKVHNIFWEDIKKCSPKSILPFTQALNPKAANSKKVKEFYLATNEPVNPKFAWMYLQKMGIGKDMNTDNILDWYRTYCKVESLPFPAKFMPDEERILFEESTSDLGVNNG